MNRAHPLPLPCALVLLGLSLSAGCSSERNVFQLVPEIVASPANLDFGDVIVDTSATMSLEISNTGRAPLTVTDLALDGLPGAAFELGEADREIAAGDTAQVPVRFTPPTYLAYTDTLRITSDAANAPEVIVRLFGEGVDGARPDLALSSRALDFGTVSMGESVPLFFSVSNAGEGDLEIHSATLSGAGKDQFSLLYPLDGQTLTSGATFSTAILYSPAGEAGDNATLTLTSNDPDEPSVEVVLLANGGGDFEYPVAALACPSTVTPLDIARIDGSGSTDPNGDGPLTFVWDVVEAPSGSDYDFTVEEDRASLLTDIAGTYQVSLFVVNAIGLSSAPATCTIDAIPDDQIHVELVWSANDSDLDLHMVRSGGLPFSDEDDACYCNPTPEWGDLLSLADNPSLDLDDMFGYGPENINIAEPADDTYQIYVHYYRDLGGGPTTATVRFYLHGALVTEDYALMQAKDLWHVGAISWPDGAVTLTGESPSPTSATSCKDI